MATINFSATCKQGRAGAINTAIGSSGSLVIYSGTQPAYVELSGGTVLATLPLSATAAVATIGVLTINGTNGGSGYTNGSSITFTGGGGSGAAGTIIVTSGAITGTTITSAGSGYTSSPTVSFSGGTGAVATAVMTGLIIFNAITQANASATGTASYARVLTSGGVAVIDLDVGTTTQSVVVNSTSLTSGAPVTVSSAIISEA